MYSLWGTCWRCRFPTARSTWSRPATDYGTFRIWASALDEIARVLTPGGLALSLDFNRPANGLVRRAYLLYLTIVGGVLGSLLHGDPDTYRYIPASIRRYPGAVAVGRLMEARGFTDVRYLPVLGGLMAIHQATTVPLT